MTGVPAVAAVPLHEPWGEWTFDPWVIGALVLSAWLYARGVRTLWRQGGRGHVVRPWQAACCAAGWASLVLALLSPIHAVSADLFSVHMVQHLILMLVSAPLVILGDPLLVCAWALPTAARLRLLEWWRDRAFARAVLRGLRHPLAVWALYAAALWTWHLPALFQATLASDLVHHLQHATFLGTSLLFWWTVVEYARHGRRRHGAGVLLVFTTMMHGMALGVLLTSARSLVYPVYAERGARHGVEALDDQAVAGLIMWMPSNLFYLLAAGLLMAAWLSAAGRRARQRDAGVAALLAAVSLVLGGCGRKESPARSVPGGDPDKGERLAYAYACGSCHRIPGVPQAHGTLGPSLEAFGARAYIAGALFNAPENLVRFVKDPESVEPGAAMPDQGVREEDARHIAAFLYTLR